MCLLLAVSASYCALTAPLASGDPVFPYKAYITAADVYVRSGPGQSYYPTDKLKAAQQVEVYRHDPGGWYAIRPPEGSFSWVSGRYLKPGVENLAVVTEDRVAARVGSRFSDIRDVIQVRLHKAEVVEVLEAKKNGTTTWYKIAPPSGEFRWVFGKYVDTDYPHDGVRKTDDEGDLIRGDALEADAVDEEPAVPSTPAAVSPAEQWEPPPGQPAITVRPPSGPAWERSDPDEPTYAPVTPRGMSSEQYQDELEQIDMELSAMVIEEPTVWEFSETRRRVEQLLDLAETAVERGRARVLLNKIARFEDIKQRHDRINLVRRETERLNLRLARLSPRQPPAEGQRHSEGRFDGVGELIRVISPKVGAPRYALVDELGQLRCYVSPAPGVSLRHYVGRQVGVSGTRGYMPEQRAHHVMAQHVRALNDRVLR